MSVHFIYNYLYYYRYFLFFNKNLSKFIESLSRFRIPASSQRYQHINRRGQQPPICTRIKSYRNAGTCRRCVVRSHGK